MSYNKRIQIIEEMVTNLDGELKTIVTRFKENISTTVDLVNNIIDDINPLYDEIKLKKDSKKGMSEKEILSLESKSNMIVEKMKFSFSLMKKNSYLQLEKLRIQNNIIRKISPNTSELLDLKINELEKNELKLLKSWIDWGKKGYDQKDNYRKEITSEISDNGKSIEEIIKIARDCIKDTIDKIKE